MAEVVRLSDGMKPEAFFEKNHGLNVPLLGDLIRREHFVKRGHDRRLYHYSDGVYQANGEDVVKARIREILGERFKAKHVHEVMTWLGTFEPEVGQGQPEGLLNVRNGLLDWRTRELRSHSPEVLSTIQLPVRWNPRAECPAFDRFIAEVVPEDALLLAWEVLGYLLLPANPLRKAIMLLGPGANGKSVYLRVCEALLGSENVANVSLQQLAEDRFAASELYGKLANVYADLDARAVRYTDRFKMVTGGDTLRGERKYRDPFYFRSMALPIFSANQAPVSTDTTEAYFDRWIVVPMETVIPEERRDPDLAEKLTEPTELEGILLSAALSLKRLTDRGRFAVPVSVRQAGTAYREYADPVAGFLAEECAEDEAAWTARSELYRVYRSWAERAGRRPLADRSFYAHLPRLGFAPAKRQGVRGFRGLRVHGGATEGEPAPW